MQENKKEEKNRGESWLASAFRAAAAYLVPISITRNPGSGRLGIDFRRTLRKTAAVVLIHAGIKAGTTLMLPTAEDYIKDRGFDPDIAGELSNNTVRIVPRNFAGALYLLNSQPTLIGVIASYKTLDDYDQANAYAGENPITSFWTQKTAILLDESVTAREFFSVPIPEAAIEYLPVSDEELQTMAAFHEFRHLHDDNIPDRNFEGPLAAFHQVMMREADADALGVGKAADVHGNPEIMKAWLYMRALIRWTDDPHNVSLYLDAKIQNKPLPSVEEMDAANIEALSLAVTVMAWDDRPQYVRMTEAMRLTVQLFGENMSPMARRRAELYIEAAEYFAPSSVRQLAPEYHRPFGPFAPFPGF